MFLPFRCCCRRPLMQKWKSFFCFFLKSLCKFLEKCCNIATLVLVGSKISVFALTLAHPDPAQPQRSAQLLCRAHMDNDPGRRSHKQAAHSHGRKVKVRGWSVDKTHFYKVSQTCFLQLWLFHFVCTWWENAGQREKITQTVSLVLKKSGYLSVEIGKNWEWWGSPEAKLYFYEVLPKFQRPFLTLSISHTVHKTTWYLLLKWNSHIWL